MTLREETEWVELVELGWNSLCAPKSARAVSKALFRALFNTRLKPNIQLYGEGDAAIRIARLLYP